MRRRFERCACSLHREPRFRRRLAAAGVVAAWLVLAGTVHAQDVPAAPSDTGAGGAVTVPADTPPVGPPPADTVAPAAVAPRVDSLPRTDSIVEPSGPGAGDSAAVAAIDSAAAARAAPEDSGIAPLDTPATATPGAPADSAAESLEAVQRDLEAARERLDEVRETVEALPAEDRPRRSPRGAVLRAFALPGWGQFYTGHAVRGFMYAGAEVGFATLGVLEQQDVNDLKEEQTAARNDFIAQQQAMNPDTVFTLEDSLALIDVYDRTADGAAIAGELDASQDRREDYFTYAIFSVLFAAIDAFVSAHLEPYDTPSAEVRRAGDALELSVRVPVGGRARAGTHGGARRGTP